MSTNTYYHENNAEQIDAILATGFVDVHDYYYEFNEQRGVWIMRFPPDPYPENQLLEITLPAELELARWERILPEGPNPWGEWVVPARVINERGKARLLTKEERQQAWERWEQDWIQSHSAWLAKQHQKLSKLGFIEPAKDAAGQLICRENGSFLWTPTAQTRELIDSHSLWMLENLLEDDGTRPRFHPGNQHWILIRSLGLPIHKRKAES